MKNIKVYFDDMTKDGWNFHSPYDESLKHCFFGDKGNYKSYLNLKNGRVEFWHFDKEWVVEPPEVYTFAELEDNSLRCDLCGEIQSDVENLSLKHEIKKYCEKCK